MRHIKRIIALLLCVIIVLGIFPLTAFAASVTKSESNAYPGAAYFAYSDEAVYCIRKSTNIRSDNGYTIKEFGSSHYWSNVLSNGVRKGIALATLYGYRGTDGTKNALRAATQVLIWDIQQNKVFTDENWSNIANIMSFSTFETLSQNPSSKQATSVFVDVRKRASSSNFRDFREQYEVLWTKIQKHATKPKFDNKTAAMDLFTETVPVFTIPSSGTLSLTDQNSSFYFPCEGVYYDLGAYFNITYSNSSDNGKVTVARNGNTLTISTSSKLVGTAQIQINKGPNVATNAKVFEYGDGTGYESNQPLFMGVIQEPIPTYIKVESENNFNFTLQKEADCSPAVTNELSGNPMYSLAGAKYEVRLNSSTGALQETLTTDASGKAVSSKTYPAGTKLYIKEVTAPPGYKINTNYPNPNPITISANSSQNTFTVKDEPVKDPINLRIYKVDKQDNAIFLQGAVFKLQYYARSSLPTSSSTPTRTWYLKSDANGLVSYDTAHLASNYTSNALYESNQVPLGYIKITEEKAPAGYAAASNTTFYYHIYQSSNGSDAAIELLNSSGNSLTTSGNIIYKSNGDINILNDKYDVKVVKSYSCSSAIYNEKIKDNPLYSLSGAVFDIRLNSATGTIQETVTTNANGEAVLTGKYAVGTVLYAVEKTAPAGYKTASAVRLTVTSNSANNIFEVNDPPVFNTFNTTLQKVDSTKATKMLQGAVFKYSYYTNYSGTGSPARVWYFRSDSDGDIEYDTSHLASGYSSSSLFTSGTIPLGRIVVEEVAAPSGYSLNTTSKAIYDITQASAGANATGTWTAGSGMFSYSNTTDYLTATNEPLTLKIQKTFASGSTGSLAGWEFLQFPANYNTSNVVAVESFISTNGECQYQDIGHDEQFYNSVWEIFHVYINGEEVGFSNDRKIGDCMLNRAPNIGDTVTVVFATVNAANYVNLGTTNASGQIVCDANAGTYTIVEVPQFGYVQQSPKTVTVTNSNTPGNPATVTFVNRQEPNFKIYKSIAANSTGSVTGWQFKVYRRSTLINTYTITQTEVINGVTYGVITALLPVGTYRVEEVAKDGWAAQPAQTVTVTNANSANNPASVSFENEKLSVHLEKQYTESGLSDGYSMVTFLSSENQNLLGEHCYSAVTVSLKKNISAASASPDIYIGTDRLTDRSRSTNTIAYAIEINGGILVRYIPEAVCYVLHNGRLLEPGRDWYVTTSDINHIRFTSALSAGDTIQIIYLTQTVDGNAAIHHITSDNAVDAHNLTVNKTYWFYEIPVPGYRANGDNPQSIQLHGNDNGQLTFINKPDVCGISIEKTTSDGSSVEGWAFNIYRDGDISRYAACTFNGTGAAAYNIFPISHNDCIDSVFAVYVNNSWYDNRNGDMFTYSETTGTLTFLKTLPQPSDTVQVVYTRENYDDPYNEDPYITDEHGLITDDDLPEGIYNVEEIPTLGYLYQPPVTDVEVVAGQITAVDFHNVPTDTDIRIEKSFKDGTYGNKQGWEFAVMDADEYADLDVDHVFMMDSFIYDSATYSQDLSRMLPGHPNVCGIYSVYRNGTLLSDVHDYQEQGGELNFGLASVENGDEITVVYSPVIDMNYLYHSPNCHIISTNQYGIANVKNLTEEWVVEEIPQYGYLQQPVKNVSVHSKTTEYLNFENTRLAKIQVKKTDTSGNPLEGVQFILQYKGIHEDTWRDAVYSANRNGAAGTFYTDNNINNNKTILTDTNGCASFNCIAASTAYEYRLVETATTTDRNGRQLSLLAQPIEIGVLPKALEFSSSAELQAWLSQQNNVSDYVVNGNSVMQYTLHYTIANGGVTQMPFTGSAEMEKAVLTGSIMMAFALGMLFIVYRKKRKQE